MEIIAAYFRGLTERYVRALIRFRFLVLLLSVTVALLLGFQAKHLVVEGSYKYMFAEHDPALVAFNEIENTYSKMDSTIFAIQPQNESICSRRIIKLVHEITQKFWEMPHTVRVDSITNYQFTRADGDDLYVGDLIADPDTLTDQELCDAVKIAASKPELDMYISVEQNTLGVSARAEIETGDNQAFYEAVSYSSAFREQLLTENPDLRIAISGLVPRAYLFYKTPLNDISTLVPLMLLLLVLVIWLLTRSLISPIVTIVLVSLACAAAMGAGALLGIPITTLSSSAPIIILTVAIADSIHILISFMMQLGKGLKRDEALVESMQLNVQPVLLTTVTTAIGFLSLNFSDSPAYQDLGNFAALGTFFAWALSMTFLPAALSIIPIKPSLRVTRQVSGIAWVSDWILRFKHTLFFIVIGATLLSFMGLSKLEFNDDFIGYFSKRLDTDVDTKFVQETLSGPYMMHYSVHSTGPNGINHPDYLQSLEDFTDWLRQQPELVSIQSFSQVMKNLNRSMHNDDESYYRIADDKQLNAQFLLLYEMSLPYGLDLNSQINVDKSATLFTFSTTHLKSRELLELAQRTEAWQAKNWPEYMLATTASSTLLISQIGINNFDAMRFGLFMAFVLIAVSIGIALTSVKLGLISIIPNTVPIIIAFGLFSISGETLGMWAPLVIPTALGLIVDATVHFLSKYKYARKYNGYDAEDSIRYAFSTVGMALWVSTLVLVLGFSILYFALITMLQYLGIGTALIIILALLVDVMILPVLLIYSEKIRFFKKSI